MGTACKGCVNLHVDYSGVDSITGYNPRDEPIWHMLYCTESPLPPSFDPLSGGDALFRKNGFEGYKHVREVNRGDCSKFVEGRNNMR